MNTLSQLIYRMLGSQLELVASSLPPTETSRWRRTLDPLLWTGEPPGRYYQNLGSQAALIRWTAVARRPGNARMAHVIIGDAAQLTDGRALQLPELSTELPFPRGSGPLLPIPATALDTAEGVVLDTQARSSDVSRMVIPVLSWILQGTEKVTMRPGPQPASPEAVLWALVGILAALGDGRPVSFLTRAARIPDTPPGLFVCFRPEAGPLAPAPGYEHAAAGLVATYVQAGPTGLYRFLRQQAVLGQASHAAKMARLLALWPDNQQPARSANTGSRTAPDGGGHDADHQRRTSTAAPSPAVMTMPPPGAAATAGQGNGQVVTCPICLSKLDWGTLPLRQWDGVSAYKDLDIPDDATDTQRAFLERGAYVQCNGHSGLKQGAVHHLPVDYGRFGPPVVLGFVGLTHSGKSHLLTAMVAAMSRLRDYGIDSRPVDLALHQRFVDEHVHRLFRRREALPVTDRGVVAFVDAFIITSPGGQARPVALFDVAGAELAREAGEKRFLDVANGFFFVVDPEQLSDDGLGDDTFTAVLNVVSSTPGRLPDQVSAAIVLNKADLVRFDDPVARWLRTDAPGLDPAEFRAESADVYAYLCYRGAAEWTRPYDMCAKATLHVASPTGGSAVQTADGDVLYPRGVRPRRVLGPLVAMLAMTGVLAGEEAEDVGV